MTETKVQKIAVSLEEAADLVPFSVLYLRRAVKRTQGNTLPARLAGRKYVINVRDLEAWIEHEGEEASA